MIRSVIVVLAAGLAAAAVDTTSVWKNDIDDHRNLGPTAEEVERRLFESRIFERLNVREYGKFDMLDQYNGHMLRIGNKMVPKGLEVMMHLLNSPIFHDSVFSNINILHLGQTDMSYVGIPIRLSKGGTAHNLVVAVLTNDVPKLKSFKVFKKKEPTWSTYIDNEAAYTFLWRLLSRQVQVHSQEPVYSVDVLDDQFLYCYRNERNEILRFKFQLSMNHDKNKQFVSLVSQWSTENIPLHKKYINMLNESLALLDRSNYPLEMFDNLGKLSTLIKDTGIHSLSKLSSLKMVPMLKPTLSLEEALDIEARNIAEVTIRFSFSCVARMLERHAIHAFSILKKRTHMWRVYGVSYTLRRIRSRINSGLSSIQLPDGQIDAESSKQHSEEIEEILFESSQKFGPYWSMRNDTLYRSSELVTLHDVKGLGLLFDPDKFFHNMINMKSESINFSEMHDILHRLTNETTAKKPFVKFKMHPKCAVTHDNVDKINEQYQSLPSHVRQRLVAKCRCLLVFLYLFGVVDRNGKLEFPWGWPRDINKSLLYIPAGIGSSCGLCNSLLGFLSGIGYPPVVENMYAWETPRNQAESAVYQMFVLSNKPKGKKHTEYYDKTLLSYVGGHYKEDNVSSLAVGYYLYSGLGNPSRLLDDATIKSGMERKPKNVGSNCIDALPFVIDAAKAAMHSRVPLVSDDSSEEYRSKRYAEFIKKLASMGDTDGLRVMGDFYYMGHEEGNINTDLTRALEYWTMAANQGDVTSALTVATHLISMINREQVNDDGDTPQTPDVNLGRTAGTVNTQGLGTAENLEVAAEGYLQMVANSPNQVAAATARFNMARYGIGRKRDPVDAAKFLQESADRGDVTSQMLMGHVYAGLLPDITPADGKNVFMALEYYRRASKNGNIVATFNAAVLTLHGYDLKYNSSVERCKASFGLFQKVGRHSLVPATVRSLAKRASQIGDDVGSALMNLFLSEMGDPDAHVAAAKQFKKSDGLCYSATNGAAETTEGIIDSKGLFSQFQQKQQSTGESPCYMYYARRSSHDPYEGSSLLYAEALMTSQPKESISWVMDAKLKNEPKANYIYAEMLEAGVGITQDCSASYKYYKSMMDSKEFPTQVLGFLCIQRARALWVLKYWPDVYTLFVGIFYDQPIASYLLQRGYAPCWYSMPKFKVLKDSGDLVNAYMFLALVAFATFVYLRMR
ncbi:hypothetical protein BgAZ_205680 [Babesia gibsoni]|uniref:Uncharacterized protein n=1 Tax=Babesia gibsoni TaxID=33632 RepID=A0AAD8LL89_BABGI|nr:hypothetical protein BgAZ_205680 [Babesia gibsoni]